MGKKSKTLEKEKLDGFSVALARIEQAQKTRAIELDLSGLELIELPETIGQLGRLRKLFLSNNKIKMLPESLFRLNNLQHLALDENQLEALPDSIGQLIALEFLSLDSQNAYSTQVGNLKSAVFEPIKRNVLVTFPESLCNLSQLKVLRALYNKLTGLPKNIGKLKKLQRLGLSGNHLTNLPESFCQLKQLCDLRLSANQLASLPKSIGRLNQLRVLVVPSNNLKILPKSIGELTQLQILNLYNNKLETLPTSICHLRQLQELWLARNQLSTLPESIDQLTRLERINLQENKLVMLPDSLMQLRSLEQLFLHSNEALSIPAEVLGPTSDDVGRNKAKPASPREILNYYFRTHDKKHPINEAKLILVGRGAVGKTSLVNRLVHGRFDKSEKKTEDIQITQWPLWLNRKEKVKLNIWDFGGQEIMHATHQFFLTQRSLYLLVLNGREGGEDADAEYWLKLIASFGADSPVIIVLNKSKEHPFDLNRRGLQQKYPNIRAFIATDCKDRTGLKDLRQAIERETDRLEHLRDAFPASWFNLKDKLAGMKKSYLSFEDYRKTCNKHGIKDASEQESLAFVLHCLGIALNYKDDPRLQDTHVLNPHWVTNGIYKILNAEKLSAQKGVLHLKEVTQLLDGKKYPPTMHRFLFNLMKKFELCFSFPENEGRYLIPELLDKQEPEVTNEFAGTDCLRFEYHYPILPEGLLPRLITRTHVLSEGLPRWRTGVILKFEGNKALVKADIPEKKVFISVTGPIAGRGRLLAVIRADFERIH